MKMVAVTVSVLFSSCVAAQESGDLKNLAGNWSNSTSEESSLGVNRDWSCGTAKQTLTRQLSIRPDGKAKATKVSTIELATLFPGKTVRDVAFIEGISVREYCNRVVEKEPRVTWTYDYTFTGDGRLSWLIVDVDHEEARHQIGDRGEGEWRIVGKYLRFEDGMIWERKE